MRRAWVPLTIAAAAVLLAGCSGSGGSAQGGKRAEPKFTSVYQIQRAYQKAGFDCAAPRDNVAVIYSAYGHAMHCEDDATLALVTDKANVAKIVQSMQNASEAGHYPVKLVEGKNWVIESSHAGQVADKIGGKLHEWDGK